MQCENHKWLPYYNKTNKITALSIEPNIKMKKLMMYHTNFIKKVILIMSK